MAYRVMLCVAALLILQACGGGSSSNENTKKDTVTGDISLNDTQTDQTSDAPGDQPGDVADDRTTEIPCVSIQGTLIPQACGTGLFCNQAGLCEQKREAGEQCDGLTHKDLSPNQACTAGFCKAGPFDSNSYCVNLKETCGNPGGPVAKGGIVCSADGTTSRECSTSGTWNTVVKCESESCSDGEGRKQATCKKDVGCGLGTECLSCAPGRFDTTSKSCIDSCSKTADCAPDAECDNGTCKIADKKGPGQSCTTVVDCKGGLFCVKAIDPSGGVSYANETTQIPAKVCCTEDCTAKCKGCKSDGTCGNVAKGKKDRSCDFAPPEGNQDLKACSFNGTCDGLGNCDRWPSGTICGSSKCECNGENCAETPPPSCDSQNLCVTPGTSTPCPVGKGCKDTLHCDFGSCTKHADCTVADNYCSNSNECRLALGPYASCKDQSYDGTKPYDDTVCKGSLSCLKDNFSETGGRCGESDKCIAPDGQSQLPVDTVKCGEDAAPRKCVLNQGKAEWEKLAACDTSSKGCELDSGTPNSGIKYGQVCLDSVGCQDGQCEACPKNVRFDPTKNACLDSCNVDGDCRPKHRCDTTKGICVRGRNPGEECQPDPQQLGYKPCLEKHAGQTLYCVPNFKGTSICCYGNCKQPCQYCIDTIKTNPYTCVNFSAIKLREGCNKNSGELCTRHTGLCDGQGECALKGGLTLCNKTCSNAKETRTFCDGKGNCSSTRPPIDCPAGTICDGNQCGELSCSDHTKCSSSYYCSVDGVCVPRLQKGSQCDAKTILADPFDDRACESGLGCYKTPDELAGYCTKSDECVVGQGNTVMVGEYYCNANQNTVQSCTSGGVWSSTTVCNQTQYSPCSKDSNNQDKGYKEPASCSKSNGCEPDDSCEICPDFLLYTEDDQPNVTIPCFKYCACKPAVDGTTPGEGLCPAGWEFDVQDSRCQDDRWCGRDPENPGSGYECRDKLSVGDLCSTEDFQQPSRQCSSGLCCPEILQSGEGQLYCSNCCADIDCLVLNNYCDVPNGGCKTRKNAGDDCNRQGECSAGLLCCGATNKCSACCSSTDCEDPKSPICVNGSCQAKKPAGAACSIDDECLSGTCDPNSKLCTCNSDAHCDNASKYCVTPGGTVCLPRQDPGTDCTKSQQCKSNNCCAGDFKCAKDCCVDQDCPDQGEWCDNTEKSGSYQKNDGKSFACKEKRRPFEGCSTDLQCSTGKCILPHGRCAACTNDNQCSNADLDECASNPAKCVRKCCGGVCVGFLDTVGNTPAGDATTNGLDAVTPNSCISCKESRPPCGKECCGKDQFCTENGCKERLLTGEDCASNDQHCKSLNCNRSSKTCE